MLPQDHGEAKPVVLGINGGPVGPGNPPAHSLFKPGQSGHPGGRKRGASILHEIERELAAGAEIGEDGEIIRSGHKAREIAQALLDVASGKRAPDEIDTKAALAVLDRTDGPIVKEINHQGGVPIRVVIKGIDSP